MSYFGEFRQHWRPLLAAFLGMGSALSLNSYILSTFAPYLIEEFGWTRSQWALASIAQVFTMFCLPVAGRLTDIFGVRRVAATGALSFPLFLAAMTVMDGNIYVFLALFSAQTMVCSTTTATIYSRLVAEAFNLRRGLALAIFGSSPPFFGAIGAPLVTSFVESHSWRAGLLVVATFCFVTSALALSLIPPKADRARPTHSEDKSAPMDVYRTIFAMPIFWTIIIALFLVNLPFTLAVSQLKMVVLDQGLPDTTAAALVSVFAISSIAGRAISGFALDYLPANIVASISFGLPVAGLLVLASPLDSVAAVTLGILLIGVSFGAEGDIVPFLVTRYFGIAIFSTVVGLLSSAIAAAIASGNVILGLTLDKTGSFDVYLYCAATGALAGSTLLLTLGKADGKRRKPANI